MILKILRYFFGYVKVEIKGFAPERFMNLIVKEDIVVWDVESTETGYIFFTGRKNLLKMKPLLQRTNVKLTIIDKKGLPYLIKKCKRRFFFIIGLLFCMISIYILSLFIWEIKVTGESKLVSKTMLKEIEEQYVSLGTLKKDVDCSGLERDLREKYEEISWISCDINGTTLTIHIEEGMYHDVTDNSIEKCDLVAGKDAVITKMITREGTPVAKVSDEVKKGDILISGTIYIYDDNNEVLETNYLAADGDIYGKVIEPYEDSIKLQYYKKNYSEKNHKYITFFVFDYCITPIKTKISSENIDTTTHIHKLKLFSDLYLPIGYKITEQNPYTLEQANYKETEAKEILESRLKEKIQDLERKGVEIIENNVKIEKHGDVLMATGNLIVNEPIAMVRELSPVVPKDTNEE